MIYTFSQKSHNELIINKKFFKKNLLELPPLITSLNILNKICLKL